MKKYNIDNLHQDVNSIYSNYDQGNTDEEITIKIALNICKTFIKDNQDIPIDRPGSIKDDPLSFVRKMKYQSMGYKLRES